MNGTFIMDHHSKLQQDRATVRRYSDLQLKANTWWEITSDGRYVRQRGFPDIESVNMGCTISLQHPTRPASNFSERVRRALDPIAAENDEQRHLRF